MPIHESITLARVLEAAEASIMDADRPGFCTHCGADAEDVEPDSEGTRCAACGHFGSVVAAEVLLHRMAD